MSLRDPWSSGTTPDPPDPSTRKPLGYYYDLKLEDESKAYIEWIDDWLGVELTPPQQEMIRTICDHQKVLIVGANGFGKSFCLVVFSLAFFYLNIQSVVIATSGTQGKMDRTYCKPIKELHQQTWGLPGRYMLSTDTIRINGYPNMYLTATSPSDPGELEGVHSDHLLGIIEEADKDGINENHIDSMESLPVDHRDKLVASANPPKDAGDVVNRLIEDPTWETLEFSSFDAWNVQLELAHDDPYVLDEEGNPVPEGSWYKIRPDLEDQFVDGIVTLHQIKTDYESWNAEEWPGVEAAMRSHEREDLHVKWYRRRLGVRPPELAVVHRPYTIEDLDMAWNRDPPLVTETPTGIGLDVARGGGDKNALVGVFGREIRVLDVWTLKPGETHVDSEEHIRDILHHSWDCRFAIDAVGEGSGLADNIADWYPNVHRFNNHSNAIQSEKYDDKWTEANAEFGKLLDDGAGFRHAGLREELRTAARTLSYNVSYTKTRGHDYLRLDSKDTVKKRLGHSPDIMDATVMAAWAASDNTYSGPREIPSTW